MSRPSGKATGGRTAVRLVSQAQPRIESSTAAVLAPRRTRKRRGDDVRDRILKAALECFGAFGFEGTSTRAVAERANVTHTLVLYHFGSKDQLWIAMMELALAPYIAELRQEVSSEETVRGALGKFIEKFVRMSARLPQVHRIMTMESNQNTERLHWVIEHYLRKHFTMVRDLIRRGQMEGSVRECDPARLYYHIIGAAGTPFTIATEYKVLTGRDVFAETEILRNIAFIYEIVFING
jgi:TetR/AcrR family transcriptional regulator